MQSHFWNGKYAIVICADVAMHPDPSQLSAVHDISVALTKRWKQMQRRPCLRIQAMVQGFPALVSKGFRVERLARGPLKHGFRLQFGHAGLKPLVWS